MSTNPYAAPRAQVADDTVVLGGDFIPGGAHRPAGRGWRWIASAFALFKAAPGVWIGMALAWFVIMMVGGMIPFLGALATSVLWPVFVAGFVTASRHCEQRDTCEFSDLFAGFRQRFGALVVVGLISLALSIAVFFAVFAVMGIGFFAFIGGNMDPQAARTVGMSVLLAILIATALLLPLAMAAWFAPPLVLFHDLAPLEAMKMSFAACLKNMLSFIVYGLVLLVAAILATIPLGLGWLVLGPVLAASVYTAYRDVYFTAPE
jgi:uncharacterized membrane protein